MTSPAKSLRAAAAGSFGALVFGALVFGALVFGASLLGAWPAHAVVGGEVETGPLARGSVMVLTARGGLCTGIVLAPDVVLTAGHCAAGTGQARVQVSGPGGPVLAEPAATAVHPEYSAGAEKTRRRSIDLGLIRLAQPLPVDGQALSAEIPAKGTALTLGGYGLAREGDGRSAGTFRSVELTTVQPHGPGRILLWAQGPGARAGESGACDGDSGGPITGPGGAVVATASWATGKGSRRCGALSQGILVGPQRAWIDATLAGWGRAASWR